MFNLVSIILKSVKTSRGELFYLFSLFFLLSLLDLLGISMLVPLLQQMIYGADEVIAIGPSFAEDFFIYIGSFQSHHLVIFTLFGFLARLVCSLVVVANIARFVQSKRVLAGASSMRYNFSRTYADHVNSSAAENIYLIQTLSTHLIGALHAVLKILSDIFLAAVLLSFLFLTEPVMFLTMVLFFGIIGALFYFITKSKANSLGRKINEAEEKVISISSDSTLNFKEAKLFNKEEFFIDGLIEQLKKVQVHTVILQILNAIPRSLMEFSFLSFFLIAWLLGKKLGVDESEMVGITAAFALVSLRLIPVASSISSLLLRVRSFENSVRLYWENNTQKLTEFLNHTPKTNEIQYFRNFQLRDISFKYEGAAYHTLKQVSFSVKKGEVVGIKGSSGVGKTTLLNIITGLIVPNSGDILLNDESLQAPEEIWPLIAYVPQDATLINGTFLENLTLSSCSDHQVHIDDIIEIVQLDNVLSSVDDGLNTQIGSNELKISGGQRQRIAIARALFHKRRILIFDEATSALDERSESELIANIRGSADFGCLIIVSHRPSTLELCDSVYGFKNGGIFEHISD